MTRNVRNFAVAIASLTLVAISSTSQASLVTNGTFDSDLAGWEVNTVGTGVTWDSTKQTANVGQFGTPGVANFSQTFDVPAGTNQLAISFDYVWQTTRPILPDTFKVVLSYLTSGGTEEVTLLTQASSDMSIIFQPPTTIYFDDVVTLNDLLDVAGNATIRFSLMEQQQANNIGTRVELDNVSIVAVPEASSFLTWATVMIGGLVVGRGFLKS